MKDDLTGKLTERYNREADDYQQLWAPVLRIAGLQLLDELADDNLKSVLDVATGVGVLLPDLRRAFPGAFIAGVDRSPGMLALAPPEFPRAVMDARQLAIASGCIDLVMMAFMLFHLEPPIDGLIEARRVLRSGGQVAIITWASSELESVAHSIWNECLRTYGAPPVDPVVEARGRIVDTPEKVRTLLEEAGFQQTRAWIGEFVTTFEREKLLRRFTRMGVSRTRFEALSPADQARCFEESRRKLAALPSGGLQARGKVVYAVAARPRGA